MSPRETPLTPSPTPSKRVTHCVRSQFPFNTHSITRRSPRSTSKAVHVIDLPQSFTNYNSSQEQNKRCRGVHFEERNLHCTPRRTVTPSTCSVNSSEARAPRRTAAHPRARTVEAPTDGRTGRRRRSMRWTSSKRCVRIDSIFAS